MSIQQAKDYVKANLEACCRDMVEYDEAGSLKKDGALRQVIEFVREDDQSHTLNVAQALIKWEAVLVMARK